MTIPAHASAVDASRARAADGRGRRNVAGAFGPVRRALSAQRGGQSGAVATIA
jgi:hypothetical protein